MGSSRVDSNKGLGVEGVGFRKTFPLNKYFVAVKWSACGIMSIYDSPWITATLHILYNGKASVI